MGPAGGDLLARDGRARNTGRAMEIEALGTPSHTRTLSIGICRDGADHVRAAGVIIDLRKRGLVPMAGDLQTSGVVHHMRVDARIDREGPSLETLAAEQPSVAFEASEGTGGECCRDPVRRIEALAGTALDANFAKRLGFAIGGPLGCSHVLTLAQLLGATARTALEADRTLFGPKPSRADGQRIFQRSLSIGTSTGTGQPPQDFLKIPLHPLRKHQMGISGLGRMAASSGLMG